MLERVSVYFSHILCTRNIIWPHRSTMYTRPVVTDGVAWSVCRSVTIVSHVKAAELTEMSFGCGLGWAQQTMY